MGLALVGACGISHATSTPRPRRSFKGQWLIGLLLLPALLASAQDAVAQQLCVRTTGYWQTHPDAWPADRLVLGQASFVGHTYLKSELLNLLGTPARGDASLILATQLIAAKLNVLQGASPLPVTEALARADALLGAFSSRLPYRTRSNTPIGADMAATAEILSAYNRGQLPGTCGTANARPVANAGPDQSVTLGRLVTLDGSGSTDPDSDLLTFAWSFVARPTGSAAVLSSATGPMPTFTPDLPGVYDIQLVVHDGTTSSTPDAVRVSTVNSRPTANAGVDQSVPVGTTVNLDGRASSDPDGDLLTYAWSVTGFPGSNAPTLLDSTTVTPSLLLSVPGDYTVQLIVTDVHGLSSESDTVTISTMNVPPVADAGPDTTAFTGDTVMLDAAASFDADGDPLTFAWVFVSRPDGSGAALSDSTAATPFFTIDVFGTYVVQLVVSDGALNSDADSVVVTTTNSRPVADAGADQAGIVGQEIALDGSASTDVDGNALAYVWALTTVPAGSAATLSDSTAVRPTFVPDLPGTYIAQLVVSDGMLSSHPDTVTVTTAPPPNQPPTASAGPDQTVAPGAIVQLDGNASSDPDGDTLRFSWSLSTPAGSTASLSAADAPAPTFVADVAGAYVAQLIVNDGQTDSTPDTVTISTGNSMPVADAGAAQTVPIGSTVQLDGSASSDADGDALQYAWSLIARPAGSAATISNATSVNPTFIADVAGTYVAQLIVGDGVHHSDPSTVTVEAQQPVDLAVAFFMAYNTPGLGTAFDFALNINNASAHSAEDVTVHFDIPAGYVVSNVRSEDYGFGASTYDAEAGEWAVGGMPAYAFKRLVVTVVVQRTGPYDLTATAADAVAPDPNRANNTALAIVTPDVNADLDLTMSRSSGENVTVGLHESVWLDVMNFGSSVALDGVVNVPIPAGYTLVGSEAWPGTSYDAATGRWTIPSLAVADFMRLTLSLIVNATGSTALNASITSSQPDPYLGNNSVSSPARNRPPVGNAGADRTVSTNATVTLDGTASTDAEGQPLTYEWTMTLRPLNSTAKLANASTSTPSFFADQPGSYVMRLLVRDSLGVASAADSVVVSAVVTNRAPVVISTAVTTATAGQLYAYEIQAADPDAGSALTFSLTTAPAGMIIDSVSGAITWTPAEAQGGAHPLAVRVADQDGLFVLHEFVIYVSSAANRSPVAHDDEHAVRVGDSLSMTAPGVLANDTDDGALTARLTSSPTNGAVILNGDGSFVYTPHRMAAGELVLAENVNLAQRMPGATATGGSCPACAVDNDLLSTWTAGWGTLEITFPSDVTLTALEIISSRSAHLPKPISGVIEVLGVSGERLYYSGRVEFPAPERDGRIPFSNLAGVRRVRFAPEDDSTGAYYGSLAELRVIGSALIRRERFSEPNLVQLLPATATATSSWGANTAEGLIDDNMSSNWFSSGAAGDSFEITFPQDVTVTQLVSLNPAGRPDGFGTSLGISCSGTFTLLDGNQDELFSSGVVAEPSGNMHPTDQFTLDIPAVSAVRHLRYSVAGCTGSFPAGFSELRVFGNAEVSRPAFSLSKKFQSLQGREAHSTPIVVNLTDDNGDGLINQDDIPDIVVPVESALTQLRGEIKAISGDDGRELFTAGAPDLVSPWSELAAGDLDGDGRPEILAVHGDQNHLIAFDHTGAQLWISDANPMPLFNGQFVGGAISIANLDVSGPPEIIVGASVFDGQGRLIGDGRTLGGTTAGTGLRSAISAVGDIDLDGVPEIIAGPTAYRLQSGQLTRVWTRADRPDGYVAIANFDDDPPAEIVTVAAGTVYMLNDDGSDVAEWNPPTHAAVTIPGGGQGGAPLVVDVDGDGQNEIGVAGAHYFVLFNGDGSVRWQSAISDRTSNATGAVAFDLNGDGELEIIYRDEFWLRIYRGADGVLLARTPVGSATWSEEPVVADVDNDGHAEIVVSSDLFLQSAGNTGILVLEDVADKWTRTRRIWNQHSYHVTNVNEDASIPTLESPHWLISSLNGFRINAFVPGETTEATDQFRYVAFDGVLQSQPATVRVTLRAPNSGPQFTSSAVTVAAVDVQYVYAAIAGDADAGDVLTFSLATAPAGMSIDSASGVVRWTPTALQLGQHRIVIKVADVHGVSALQGYTIEVATAVTVPDVVGHTQVAAVPIITSANLVVGVISSRHSPTVAAGSVISQNPAAGSLAAAGAPVSLVVSLGAAPVGTVPDVVGQPQATAQADIVAAQFMVGAVTGQNSGAVPAGIVLAQSPAAGTSAAPGSAIAMVVSLGPPPGTLDLDGDGYTGDLGDCNDTDAAIHPGAFDASGDGIDHNCNGVDSIAGDDTAPTATFDSPDDLAAVTMPTDISGTVGDANLLRYTLRVTAVDEDTFTTIGSGTAAVTNGVLGRLDPTLLENGLYRVQLVAEDVNGQATVDERVYSVSGEAKVGIFRLSFTDLEVPIAGVPITVTRTYDSRVKAQRDFGIGWTLDVAAGRYQNNRRPGEGWTITQAPGPFGLPCTVLNETKSHVTEIRLSDREVYRFQPRLANVAAIFGGCAGDLTYQLIGGTYQGATLEPLDGASFIYTSGDTLEQFDGSVGTGVAINPSRVRLRTVDGRVIELARGAGIYRIEDSNGNAVQITSGGIVHSGGRSVSFARDAEGRIATITDPMGRQLTYLYESGDLVAFHDQLDNPTTFTYDGRHHLLTVTNALGVEAVRSEYDADGRLIAVTDARGHRTEFTHDIDAQQETITDALGHATLVRYDGSGNVLSREQHVTVEGRQVLVRTQYTYDATGNITSTIDPDGRTQNATWDAFGNELTSVIDPAGLAIRRSAAYSFTGGALLSETDPNGLTTSYTVDKQNNPTTWTDVDGGTSTITYDRNGNVTGVTDPDGRANSVSYDPDGRPLARRDAAGALVIYTYDAAGNKLTETVGRTVDGVLRPLVTRFEYDAKNRVVRVLDPLGHARSTTYDALGRVVGRTDPLGRTTTFVHDEIGDLTKITYPDGTAELMSYDARGALRQKTDREGLVTRFERDELGRAVATTWPGGGITRTVYSPGGLEVATIAPDGARTDFEYDAAGRRVLVRQPAAPDGAAGPVRRAEWRFEHDPGGRTTAVVDPRGNRREVTYDTPNGIVRFRLAGGAEITETWDRWGRVLSRTDEDGNTTTFEYLADTGRVVSVTLPAPAAGAPQPRWQYAYDEAGHRTTQQDPLGRTTRFAYDEVGRLRRLTLPAGQFRTFAYDAAGRLSHAGDLDGSVTVFEYDAADRLVRRELSDGTATSFTYTPGGRRANATDARGVTTYAYDAAGRLTAVAQPGAGAVNYAYDLKNRLTRITTNGGETAYGYDALDRLTAVDTPAGTTEYVYDVAGNLAAADMPNGISGRFTYDARNQLTSLVYQRLGAPVASFAYTYTPAGRRASVDENGATTSFTYDRIGRLIREARVGSSALQRDYTYDAAGNRTATISQGIATTFAYDQNDRLLSAGSITYSYDDRGNLVSRNQAGAVTSFAWSPDNRLASATAGGATTTFQYDPDGVRTAKVSAAGTTNYIVDTLNPTGLSQVVEERDGAGALVARNHYGFNPVSSLRAGAERFYVANGVGSIRLLTDAAGAPIADHAYDAYGNTLQTTGTADDPYRYGGQQLDAETGLYYLRQRYYDPVAGRFLGMDPVAGDPLRPLTLNRYAYALNDPVNLADPTGEFFTLIGVSLAGLQDGAGDAVELTTKTQQLCRFKVFACAAGLLKQIRTAHNLTSLLNAFTTSVTLPTTIGPGQASVRPDLKLVTYEDQRETASPSAIKQFSIVAKFPAAGALDLEIKGQRFGGGLSFGITPQWGGGNFTYQGVQGSLEQEFQLYVFDPCAVPMGSLGLGIATQAGYARGQGMMGTSASAEITLKFDIAFLPAVDWPLLKVPWW